MSEQQLEDLPITDIEGVGSMKPPKGTWSTLGQKEYDRRYYQLNKDKWNGYHDNRKEYDREYRKKFYKLHREELLEYGRRYRHVHKEEISKQKKEYRQKNLRRIVEYDRTRGVDRIKRIREKLFNHLGSKCVRCGITDIEVIQFDHIEGGGMKESKELGSNTNVLRYYCKNIELAKERLQILCANCHMKKTCEETRMRNGKRRISI